MKCASRSESISALPSMHMSRKAERRMKCAATLSCVEHSVPCTECQKLPVAKSCVGHRKLLGLTLLPGVAIARTTALTSHTCTQRLLCSLPDARNMGAQSNMQIHHSNTMQHSSCSDRRALKTKIT